MSRATVVDAGTVEHGAQTVLAADLEGVTHCLGAQDVGGARSGGEAFDLQTDEIGRAPRAIHDG